MNERKPRTAVVGCGQIADAHLGELRKLPSVDVVAVCDTRPELAEQAADRFDVPHRETDFDALLRRDDVDAVHLCTPAHTHGPMVTKSLEAGKHTYVEKPFTVDAAEAEEVLRVARSSDALLCLGHDQLFDPLWLRATKLIEDGHIGAVRHVDSHVGYSLSGPFGREVAGDPNHWVRRLPGGLFQNTISHPLYRITEFVRDERPNMRADWLENGNPIPADLRVQLWDAEVTGTLLFTSRVKPNCRTTRLYGEAGTIDLDFDGQTLRVTKPASLPGAFEKLERPARQLTEAAGNLVRNSWRFLRGDIHYFHGMRNLFAAFYESVRTGGPPPITYDEMYRVTDVMDRIFADCRRREDAAVSRQTTRPTPAHDRVSAAV